MLTKASASKLPNLRYLLKINRSGIFISLVLQLSFSQKIEHVSSKELGQTDQVARQIAGGQDPMCLALPREAAWI